VLVLSFDSKYLLQLINNPGLLIILQQSFARLMVLNQRTIIMSQETGPLYGALVITSHEESLSGIPGEEQTMEEQTRLMIEEAAYFLAEKRGFAPGYELQDWLQAEEQLNKSP
jgi:hypothetical protein